ncbi:T9SS type A sorting domain-containing protein [Spirosoma horti]
MTQLAYNFIGCTWLRQWLFICCSCLVFILGPGQVFAQQLDTQPLAVTSVCAGTDLEVKGVKSSGGISFTVELSDGGGAYTEIPSALIASSGRYEFTCRATIPANTPAGNNYRIRIVSRNPDVVGTPSVSVLTVKARPAPPTVPNPPSDCQFVASLSTTNTNTSHSSVGVSNLIPASTVDFYDADGAKVAFSLSQYGDLNASSRVYNSEYRINGEPGNKTYLVTQRVEECASEKVAFQFTTLARAKSGPAVMTTEKTSVAGVGGVVSAGLIDLCQSGNSLNFSDLPVNAEPGFHSGFCEVTQSRAINTGDQVRICDKNSTSITADSVGKRIFRLYSIPSDPNKYCTNHPNADTYLVVNIKAQPSKPTIATSSLSLCQFQTASPLSATATDAGASLVWYGTAATGGTSSTIASQPSTATVGTFTYYVAQKLNDCESPKVAIQVFVQTTPTVSLLGTTTTNLGIEVPLTLTFTGVGPYRFTFSNGLSGTSVKDTTLLVLPDHTTTYQVTEVANKCGTGLPGAGGTATVTVLIPTIETLAVNSSTLCAGTSLTTNFITTGTLNPGSVFTLQVTPVETDTAKFNFIDIPTNLVTDGKLIGTIPANTPAGSYWIRVTATNPKIPVKGSISPTRLTVQARPTATLTGNQTIYEGQPATLSVAFTGDSPWEFSYHDSTATGVGSPKTVSTSANPYVFDARPIKTTSYLLTAVSNGCGESTLLRQVAVVNLIPLLGVDDQSLASNVTVYPVPATTTLTVQIDGLSMTEPALLEVTDLTGQLICRQQTRQAVSLITLDHYSPGTYVLRIKIGDRTTSKRIVKF